MGKTGPLWRNIALCERCLSTSSHEFISSSDVSKLRRSNDHVRYGDGKTINVKAVCTCENLPEGGGGVLDQCLGTGLPARV